MALKTMHTPAPLSWNDAVLKRPDMKKLLFSGLFLLLFQVNGFSQRFYVRAAGGYGWPSSARNLASNYRVQYTAATNSFTETYDYNRGSYGAGLTGSLAFGYRFTDQFWVEGGPAYLAGKTYHSQEHYAGSFTGDKRTKTYARMPAILAAVVVSPSGRHWRPFARAGILAGKPRIYNRDQEAFNNDVITREWEIKGKTAWGFQGGLGLHYALDARLGVFVEGTFRSLCFVPKKGSVTRYEKNGADQLHALSVGQRELVYKDSYTINSGDSQGPGDQPGQTGNDPLPFGAVGLQLGLQLNLR
jgi:hypothetical protein